MIGAVISLCLLEFGEYGVALYKVPFIEFVVTFKVIVEICGVAIRCCNKGKTHCYHSHCLSLSGLNPKYIHTAECKAFLGMRSVRVRR